MNATHSVATTLSDFYNIDTSSIVNIHDAARTSVEQQVQLHKRKMDQLTDMERAKKAEYNRKYRLRKN
jgi:hypothetical protein